MDDLTKITEKELKNAAEDVAEEFKAFTKKCDPKKHTRDDILIGFLVNQLALQKTINKAILTFMHKVNEKLFGENQNEQS